MSGRDLGALTVAAVLVGALYWVGNAAPPAEAAEMCPPVTMDILFPPTTEPPPTTTTIAPETTTTTVPPSTTTVPATTTTLAETTTTTLAETTTTSVPSEGSTTTPPVETTTTLPPETTTTVITETTLPPATTTTAPPPPPCDPFVYDMVWPLGGTGQIGSPFGADRDGGARKHQGVDIAAPKLTPVVAVADGVVVKAARDVGTANCCWAIIQHTDGWQSYYIHLNNDRHGTDDGLGIGVRPDLVEGVAVAQGDLIGWVGDSGNAEETVDHLHFELRNPERLAVDPRPSLLAAQSSVALADPQPAWPYTDDDAHLGEWAAAWLLTEGLLLDCDGTGVNMCPEQVASIDLAASVGAHLAGRAVPSIEGHSQGVPDHLQGADARALGSALGCESAEACHLVGYPETEVARIAVWIRTDALVSALRKSPAPEGTPDVFFVSAEEAEARLRSIGAREACNPPLDGQRLLTRSETLVRLVSWVQGVNPEPCQPDQPTR